MNAWMIPAMSDISLKSVIPSSIGILASSFRPGPAKSRAFAAFSAGAPFGFAAFVTAPCH